MSKGYEEAGMLIPANASNSTILKDYGSGTINYKNLKKSQGTLKEQYDNISTKILNLDKDSPTYDKELKSLEVRQNGVLSMQSKFNDNSVALKVAEKQASGKSTGTTYSEHRATWNDAIKGINSSIGFKSDGIASEALDGKKRLNGAEAIEFRNKKLNEKKKAYARGLLDDKGDFINSDSEDWANANGFNSVISEIRKEQFGAEGDNKEVKVDTKKSSKEEKVSTLIKDNPELNEDVALGLINLSNKKYMTSPRAVSDMLQQKYPKKKEESQEAYLERIDTIAIKVWDTYKSNMDKNSNEKKRLEELRKKRFKETSEVKSNKKNKGTLSDIYQGGESQLNQKEINRGG